MSETCQECGFDYDAVDIAEAPDLLRKFGRRFQAPLTRFLAGEEGDEVVRAHPLHGTWSALEYACHVRDVFDVQRERLALALEEDTPELAPMGRDERAERDGYNEQDPAEVSRQVAAAAEALAEAVAALDEDQLARTVIYGYPERRERTLDWVVRHTVHEGEHHLLDVGRVLRAARGR